MKIINKISSFFFLLLLLIIASSCEKTANDIVKDKEAKKITKAIAYSLQSDYEKQITTAALSKSNSKRSKFKSKKILWKSAFLQKIKDKNYILAPITLTENLSTNLEDGTRASLANLSMLIAEVDSASQTEFEFEIITKLPDKDYLFSTESYPKFTGKVLVEDIFEGNVRGYQFNKDNSVYTLTKTSQSAERPTQQHRPTTECRIIDWYSCATVDGVQYDCAYIYSDTYCWSGTDVAPSTSTAAYGVIGESTGSGGSTPTSVVSTPYQGYARICASSLNWTKVSNSWSGSIQNVAATALYDGPPDAIHTPDGNAITVVLPTLCVSIPSYNMSAATASKEFAATVNFASHWVQEALRAGEIPPTHLGVRTKYLELIKKNLLKVHPGSTLSTGPCSGTVVTSTATYGC